MDTITQVYWTPVGGNAPRRFLKCWSAVLSWLSLLNIKHIHCYDEKRVIVRMIFMMWSQMQFHSSALLHKRSYNCQHATYTLGVRNFIFGESSCHGSLILTDNGVAGKVKWCVSFSFSFFSVILINYWFMEDQNQYLVPMKLSGIIRAVFVGYACISAPLLLFTMHSLLQISMMPFDVM